MRIGIVTCWKSMDNYGQLLQCYALQTLLRSWGHDAFLIRYAPKGKNNKSIRKRIENSLLDVYCKLYIFIIGTGRKHSVRKETLLRHINNKENRFRHFEEFRKENIIMSPLVYYSFEELQANPPEADLYITGSDQVWHNPYNEESVKGYFLQFGSSKTIRISYAASIGRSLNTNELQLFRKFLQSFDAISVREETACQLCIEQGFKAQVCIDPTMLLSADKYICIAKQPKGNKKYAFIYVLNVKSAEEFFWPAIKEYISQRHLELKSVTGSGYYQGRELIKGHKNLLASIPEWIGYMQQAECVFTTSFHGTVFAILMHRPFLTIGLQGKYCGSNTRVEQLLSMLGIPERMFNPHISIQQQMDETINWRDVDQRIDKMKLASFMFLKDNLK